MKKPLQWHPAFQAVLQIEFADEAEHLRFYKEYNLTDSPLRIDTLIIKMKQGVRIQKKDWAHIPPVQHRGIQGPSGLPLGQQLL